MHVCYQLARRTLLIGLGALLGASAAGATEINAHVPLVLHGGPGDAFAVRSTVEPGSPITVLWCNGDATWCLVQYGDGLQGWAPISSLKAAPGPSNAKAEATAGASAAGGAPDAAAARANAAARSSDPSSDAGGALASPLATNVGSRGASASTPAASLSVKTP